MPINQLIELIEKVPPSNTTAYGAGCSQWSWRKLSGNPGITFEYILSHLDKPWDWMTISENPMIKFKDVLGHLDLDWNWSFLSINPSIKLKEMFDTRHDFPWDWAFASKRGDLTIDIIANHLDISWEWYYGLPNNKSLKITHLEVIKYPKFPWNFFGVSHLLECTMENIVKYPRFPWNLWNLSRSSKINISLILNHLELSFEEEDGTICTFPFPWEWRGISSNPGIKMRDILNNLNLPWNWAGVSLNPNITEDDVLDNLNAPEKSLVIPWDWDALSSNPNITAKLILNTPNKPWNWCKIAGNPMNRNSAAMAIQKFYRKHGAFPRWRKGIEDSNIAILYNPKIGGIKFLREREIVESEYNNS